MTTSSRVDAPTRFLSVIVADDVVEIQSVIRHWLEAHGHRVVCVSTGNEAIELVRVNAFDLVILDVLMPDGDGLDALRELHAHPTRVLAISGGGKYLDGPGCVKLATSLGAHAAVLKPFNEDQLLAGIARALAPA